jgi:hypothetical protein
VCVCERDKERGKESVSVLEELGERVEGRRV